MTNDDLDYIEAELRLTTVGFINKNWKVPPAGTHWANAFARLESLRQTTPPPPPPPAPAPSGLQANYQKLYSSFAAPASPTKTVASQSDWNQLQVHAGDDVLVKAGTYGGQCELRPGTLATGKIAARVRFESGVQFRNGQYVGLYVNGASGLLLEGPADVMNPNGDGVRLDSCSWTILKGLVSHDSQCQGVLVQALGSYVAQEVWVDGVEVHGGGYNGAAWSSYPALYWMHGAHGVYYGGGTGSFKGGGVVNCNVHDRDTGYGIQAFGNLDGMTIDGNTVKNMTGVLAGSTPNPQPGVLGDRAGIGIQIWGDPGITSLHLGTNAVSGCVYKDVNVTNATLA